MGGLVMWIVLGSLVGVVAIFLVVASVLDRKKMKKFKAEKAVLTKNQQAARANVAIWVNIVAKENQAMLDKFVPSVGSVKMSEIRTKAKKSLELLEKRKEFKLAAEPKENKELIEKFKELKETNSNIWSTKLAKTLAWFDKEEKAGLEVRNVEDKKGKGKKAKVTVSSNAEVVETAKAFKEEATKAIKGEYK